MFNGQNKQTKTTIAHAAKFQHFQEKKNSFHCGGKVQSCVWHYTASEGRY